jgi:phage-related protein
MSTWYFGGTNLSSFGAITLLDDDGDTPDRRGEDIVIPFRNGRVPIAKYYDSRVIMFGLTINTATKTDLQDKLDDLRALLSPRVEQELQVVLDDTSVRTANAVVNKSFKPTHLGPLAVKLTIEFTLADPFFYSDTEVEQIITIDASPKTGTVENPGTVEERNATITLTGPLTNPVITNTTNGVVLTYTGAIAGGEVVVIATNLTGEYTAVKDGTTNVIGNVTHSGSSALMIMDVGDNDLSITSDVTSIGTVTVAFYPPYL